MGRLRGYLVRARQDFDRFANQSTMKSFTFISNAEYKPESIWWIVVIAIFISLTIWNVSVTVASYRKADTVSKVSSATKPVFDISNPTICLTNSPLIQSMPTNSEFNLTNVPDMLGILEKEVHRMEQIFKRFSSVCFKDSSSCVDEDYEEYLSKSQSPSNITDLIDSAWYLSRLINEVEINQEVEIDDLNSAVSSLLGRNKHLKELLKNPDNLRKLQNLIGSVLCFNLNVFTLTVVTKYFNHTKAQKSYAKTPCHPENILWMGVTPDDSETDQFCINVTVNIFLRFNLHEVKQAFVHMNPKSNFTFGVNLNFNKEVYPTLRNPNILPVKLFTQTVTKIEPVGRYKNYYNPRKDNCAVSTELSDCIGLLSARQVEKYCKCWPSTWNYTVDGANVTSVQNCSFNDYFIEEKDVVTVTDCVKEVHKNNEDLSKQQRKCKPPCSYTLYHFDTADTKADGPYSEYNTTVVELKPRNFVYNEVEEVLAMDLRGFLSALGGSFSLWIGASFIGLLHVVTFMLRQTYQYIVVNRKLNKLQKKNSAMAVIMNMKGMINETKKPVEVQPDPGQKVEEIQKLLESEENRLLLQKLLDAFKVKNGNASAV